MSYSLQHFEQIALRMKAHDALAEVAAAQDFGGKIAGDDDAFSGAHFLAGADQGFPCICRYLAGKKNFDAAGAMLAAAKEPGGEHARIVQHQAVVGMHIGGKIAKHAILPGAFRAVDHQHARAIAIWEGLLRDQFLGQVVIEIGNQHLL